MPLSLSIITTAYNAEQFIVESIQSILRQTHIDFEYIVVDDGSLDRTFEKIESFGDSRLRFRRVGRVGRARALNMACKMAKGSLLAIHDADDVSRIDRISIQMKLMEGNPAISVLGANQKIFHGDDSFPDPSDGRSHMVVQDITGQFAYYNALPHSSLMIRRNAFEMVGGYDESLQCVLDWDLYVRLLCAGHKIYKCSVPLVMKRIHADQYFESRNHMAYALAGARVQARAIRELRGKWLLVLVIPWFLYRLTPRGFRLKIRSHLKMMEVFMVI